MAEGFKMSICICMVTCDGFIVPSLEIVPEKIVQKEQNFQ